MSTDPFSSDQEDFERDLEILRAIIHRNLQRLDQDPNLGKQLEFWLESARFTVNILEIWEETSNQTKYEEAAERMRMVFDILRKLIEELEDDEEEGSV